MFRAPSAHHQEYLKTSTAATGTCVIVAGQSSHLLIRAVVCMYCMYVSMFVCMYVCMYVCVYVRMYVCMYVSDRTMALRSTQPLTELSTRSIS